MDANVEKLTREILEQESRVREACRARNRAQENAYVEEGRLAELRKRLEQARLSESQTDPRQLLNG